MNYNEQTCDCYTLTQQQGNYLFQWPNKLDNAKRGIPWQGSKIDHDIWPQD